MKVKLKDVLSEIIVPMRDKPKEFNGDISWCKIEDIDGKYLYGTKSNKYVSIETVKSMNLKIIPKNSVLFTCSATIGVTAINKNDLCTNQTFIGLVPSGKIDCDFLYYYLILNKKRFEKLSSVTTIPYISKEKFENFEIDLFEIEHQKKISLILKSYDDKIEINKKINKELKDLSSFLFDYWFLQFDFPDINGKPYKSNGGKMIWNEEFKREIPLDWKIENIEECCKIVDCLHAKKSEKYFEDEKHYLFQLENIADDGLVDLKTKYFVTKTEYDKWTSRIEVKENDILITNAGRVAATAQIPSGVISGIGRNITAIRPIAISSTYLFLSFYSADLKRQIKLNTDSGAFFTSLNVKGIKKLFILRPPIEIEEQFEKIVYELRRKREINNEENHELSSFRDWLLPMLMNGQVSVGSVEKEYKIDEEVLGRVTEPALDYAKVISLFNETSVEEGYYDKRKALAVYIINQSLNDVYFGDTKLMKLLHLADYLHFMRFGIIE